MKKFLMAFSIVLFAIPLYADVPVPKPEDFAGALVLDGTGGNLLKIEVPEAVYRGLERPDQGDIRVFDSKGEMVPFVVRPTPGKIEVPAPVEIPFFLWKEEPSRVLPNNTDIEIDTAGTVLRIKNQMSSARAQPVYLLDLSALDFIPAELLLEMGEEEFFNTAAILFSSSDLNTWKEMNKRQTIAWYGHSGVSRTIVELPGEKFRYLLLRFDRGELKPSRIFAHFNEVEVPAPAKETAIGGGQINPDKRSIEYNTGGFFPLVSVNFKLRENDSVDVRVKNKIAEADDWNSIANLTLYRLNSTAGDFLYNRPLKTASSAPYWRIEAPGEFVFASSIECYIAWKAYEIIFLGRGEGPWTLSWGNADFGPVTGGLRLDEYADESSITTAGIVGEPVYKPREKQTQKDWKQWILWSILIAAALILLTLAYVTVKTMNREK